MSARAALGSVSPRPGGAIAGRLPAAPWRRAAARLVDVTIVFFVLWALVVLRVFWFMGSLSERVDPQPWGRAFVPTVAFVSLHLLYEVVFVTYNQGQTPGKDRFKIRVVGRHDQSDVGIVRAALRSLLPALVWLASPVWLALAMLLLLGTTVPLTRRRAAWHDHLSGTVVVHHDRSAEEGEGE